MVTEDSPNEIIRKRSAAEAYMRSNPHSALIELFRIMSEKYNLTAEELADMVRHYIRCATGAPVKTKEGNSEKT